MSNVNKPAFPRPSTHHNALNGSYGHHEQEGMTLREYYAGLAMQGIISACGDRQSSDKTIAYWAVQKADALIAELAKTEANHDL